MVWGCSEWYQCPPSSRRQYAYAHASYDAYANARRRAEGGALGAQLRGRALVGHAKRAAHRVRVAREELRAARGRVNAQGTRRPSMREGR